MKQSLLERAVALCYRRSTFHHPQQGLQHLSIPPRPTRISMNCPGREPSTGTAWTPIGPAICRSVPACSGNSHDPLPTQLSHKENHH